MTAPPLRARSSGSVTPRPLGRHFHHPSSSASFRSLMATTLAEVLFWIAAVAIGVSQLLILRSTRRGIRASAVPQRSALEWSYAVVPAAALAVVLVWTWRTMHDSTVRFETRPHSAEVRS